MFKHAKWGMVAVAAVVGMALGIPLLQVRPRGDWAASTAHVSGFGGASGRRGSVDVHLRNATGFGVIRNVRPDQLSCRVGQKVAVEQSGPALRGLPGTCRTSSRHPGQLP